MSKTTTGLVQFLGQLYSADPQFWDKLRMNPEGLFETFHLTEWQRELLFSLDREKIAEAAYLEIIAHDPFDLGIGARSVEATTHPHILWAKPVRKIIECPPTITNEARATLALHTAGVRNIAVCTLQSHSNGESVEMLEMKVDSSTSGNGLDSQHWIVTFNLRDFEANTYFRLHLDDKSGELVWKAPVMVVAADRAPEK